MVRPQHKPHHPRTPLSHTGTLESGEGDHVVEHKTQVSPCSIKSDLKHHKSDSYIDPKRFCEVEQQARPSMGAGLAKNNRKSAFQSFLDPNPGLTGSNPVSTPNPDPNPVLIQFLLLIRF